ncbi:hypothetical protein [Leptothermofonsia sp. ETS-13]|uniref:hypothetical protein n=1 Tax=Leptothermofonsia sp. ETS-13 TaxID=3035696 RepID=UPI003B9F1083
MKRSILSATLLSCTVFSCLTLPLAVFGSHSIGIEFQKEPIFFGKLRDIAPPYLAVAATASLGTGVLSLLFSGWRRSSHKSAQIQKQLSQLQQELYEKESLLDELRLSESHLQSTGLHQFLNPKAVPFLAVVSEKMTPQVMKSIVEETPEEVIQPMTMVVRNFVHQPESIVLESASPATSSRSAQTVIDTIESTTAVMKSRVANSEKTPVQSTPEVLAQVDELQTQLEQMAAQLNSLHTSLRKVQETPVAQPSEPPSSVLEHLHRRLQLLESTWMKEQAAS